LSVMGNGDTLIVGDGNYPESVSLGRLSNVTIQAAATGAVLDGHGARASQGMHIAGSGGANVVGMRIVNWGSRGIFVSDSSNVNITNCVLDGNGKNSGDSNGVAPAILTTNSSDVTI